MQKLATLLAFTAVLAAGASAQGTFKIDRPVRAELGLYIPTFSGSDNDLGVAVGAGYAFYRYKNVEFAGVARGQFYHASDNGFGGDFSLTSVGVDARYRPVGEKYFVGLGLLGAHLDVDTDFGSAATTKLGYSLEAGYDFTEKLYGVVRFQDTTQSNLDVYRGVTVGVGYRF